MKDKFLLNLQCFSEGGDGASASAATGTDLGSAEASVKEVATPKGAKDLSTVIYGKAQEEVANPTTEVEAKPLKAEDKAKAFEELIKGEYKDEFTKRTQGIINNRFKETKAMEDTLKGYENLVSMLSDKYGTDAKDVAALTKAIESDDSFYEQEALEKGLTVKQLKEVKALERENAEFRKAQEEAETKANNERITAEWLQQTEDFKAKYGLNDFDFYTEINTNEDFTKLLSTGVSVESAYMATHFDEMMSGAMAKTASAVKQQLVNSIGQRASRVSENGTSASKTATFKTDVNALTKADRAEIMRRVARGEVISF